LKSKYYIPGLKHQLEQIVHNCVPCQKVNACRSKAAPGKGLLGDRVGTYWEVDFTIIKPGKYGYKYLLVFIDTFSGCVEAFPTKQETVPVVAKKILEEIFPLFGVPKVIGSDNGPAFLAKVSQGVAK
jgi:transposase InsO family protein